MTPTYKESASDREILLVGPYGVLGTGVIDAVAANSAWRVTTAARRPAPTYRTQTPPRHISVDLMDREGTIKAFSNLDTVSDLVYAAYVEMPTMAETVEPNARMLTNTLEALAARHVDNYFPSVKDDLLEIDSWIVVSSRKAGEVVSVE